MWSQYGRQKRRKILSFHKVHDNNNRKFTSEQRVLVGIVCEEVSDDRDHLGVVGRRSVLPERTTEGFVRFHTQHLLYL